MEEEWPPRAQHVILTLWDMVDQFMEKADRNQVDMMSERALKNETLEEKEALQVQKEDLELEKLELFKTEGGASNREGRGGHAVEVFSVLLLCIASHS